jgi:hypothetical protein
LNEKSIVLAVNGIADWFESSESLLPRVCQFLHFVGKVLDERVVEMELFELQSSGRTFGLGLSFHILNVLDVIVLNLKRCCLNSGYGYSLNSTWVSHVRLEAARKELHHLALVVYVHRSLAEGEKGSTTDKPSL